MSSLDGLAGIFSLDEVDAILNPWVSAGFSALVKVATLRVCEVHLKSSYQYTKWGVSSFLKIRGIVNLLCF